jgi:hypothetical protein|tara:strand:+ start:279 stop:416 length:138 start_codon:yes stop_codon:yes gene_type:complete
MFSLVKENSNETEKSLLSLNKMAIEQIPSNLSNELKSPLFYPDNS